MFLRQKQFVPVAETVCFCHRNDLFSPRKQNWNGCGRELSHRESMADAGGTEDKEGS